MKKVLFTATVDSHINHFHLPYLKLFKENGYEVHVATNTNDLIEYCDVKHKISIKRSPFKISNLKAIRQLKKIIDNEDFDIIHCHTPMGSVVTRIAAKKSRKQGTKVIYTAHGFHFFKGASIINWLLFYPVEKILSKYTDTLITINKEDYNLAKKKFIKTNVEYVPGVGIDSNKFNFEMTEKEKIELRESVCCNKDSFIMIFPAELSKRKNQKMLIKSMDKLIKFDNKIHLLLPGKDSMKNKYKIMVEKIGLEKNIHFLGYRSDIPKLLKISNILVSSSKQEGLPVNIIEGMFVGLPLIVTDCRGNRDLINNDICVVNINDIDSFIKIILNKKNDTGLLSKRVKYNLEELKLENIIKKMIKIYGVFN